MQANHQQRIGRRTGMPAPVQPAAIGPGPVLHVGWDTRSPLPGALSFQCCHSWSVGLSMRPLGGSRSTSKQSTLLLLTDGPDQEQAATIERYLREAVVPALLIGEEHLVADLVPLAMARLRQFFPAANASIALVTSLHCAIAFVGENRHMLLRGGRHQMVQASQPGHEGYAALPLAPDDWIFLLAKPTRDAIPTGTSTALALELGNVKDACRRLVGLAAEADALSHHAAIGAHLL